MTSLGIIIGRYKRSKNPLKYPLTALVIAFVIFVIWFFIGAGPVNRDNPAEFKVEIRQGTSLDDIADTLAEKKLIRNKLVFIIWARLAGSNVQAGQHFLSPSFSVWETVSILQKASSDEIPITIPPGLMLNEITDIFRKYGYTEEEITEALNYDYSGSILSTRPPGASLEGYIFPDTYNIFTADKLTFLVQKAIDRLNEKTIGGSLVDMSQSTGLTYHEILTLASIVQKEVGDPEQQKLVAGVFLNRMEIGMNLGSDVTFQYAYKQGLCNVNGPTCDSAYNTRNRPGLPPGPISNSNLSAIDAVVNPTPSDYLFFLAGDDGKIYYATTDAEHQRNIVNHCQKNCR